MAVFCIWIPAHLDPPVSELYYQINKYWDHTSKCLICIVDACLNYMFLRIVNQRLVKQHGLRKYKKLVRFNARIMVISVCMDILLVGLMSLPNKLVYIQFHPVVYTVKLNIEMTMAALITKIARDTDIDHDFVNDGSTSNGTHFQLTSHGGGEDVHMVDVKRQSVVDAGHGKNTICKEMTIQVVSSKGSAAVAATMRGNRPISGQHHSKSSSRHLEDDQLPLKRQQDHSGW